MNLEIIAEARRELQAEHERIVVVLEQLDRMLGVPGPVSRARNGDLPAKEPALPTKRIPMGTKINRAASTGRGVHGALAASVPALRGLKEPFRAGDVETACKVDKKKASNLLVRLKAKGWVTCVAHGEYQRTKILGGHAAKMDMLGDIHKEIAANKPKED